MELEKAKAPMDQGVTTDYAAALTASGSVSHSQERIHPNTHPLYLFTKRCFDILVSALALILLSPLMLLTAIAIKIEDPKGKVFYRQERIGQHGKAFWCHNLRWMENMRRINEVSQHIGACICAIQTADFSNAHFRHQNGVFPAVETG